MADIHGYSDDDMVPLGVAVEITGFGRNTLRRWDKAGDLPVYRTPGGRRRYRVRDLRAVLKRDPESSDRAPEPNESNGGAAA